MKSMLTVALLSVLFAGSAPRQQIDPASTDALKRVYQQIKGHLAKNNWKEASELMTGEAQDQVCVQVVREAVSLVDMEMQISLPGIEEAQDAIAEVLTKYGMEDIDIGAPVFRMSFGGEEIDHEKHAKERAESAKAAEKVILEGLAKQQNRWAVVAELWAAKSKSPFGLNPLTGDIKKIEVNDDSATLEVARSKPETENEDGMRLVIASPPVFLTFIKQGQAWKYAGLDEAKNLEAMKNFRPGARDDY